MILIVIILLIAVSFKLSGVGGRVSAYYNGLFIGFYPGNTKKKHQMMRLLDYLLPGRENMVSDMCVLLKELESRFVLK